MVLVGLFPTSGMTISWTGFARGNVAAALKMTVLGLLIVFVPMVAGVLTRKLLVHRMGPVGYKERAAKVFPGLSVVGVVAIVFLAIGLKADMIVADPGSLVIMLVPIVLFCLVSFALTTLLGRLTLTRGDAIAMVYGTVMRNLSIALGIAIAGFGAEAALVLALSYIVQVQGAAWYVRLADRVFGSPVPAAEAATA
jgi:ACR3 family arsenite efflux pump ArsB